MAIFNAIDRHSAKKTVYIDGLAASIASVIAMAGESVIMADNAMFMIHDPFGGVLGNATEMRTVADALDKIKEGMITSYQRKSRLPGAEISQMMTEETWMTAKEAFEKGFITQIGKAMQMAASVHLDPTHYKKLPPSFLPRNRGDGPEADTMFQRLDAVKKNVNEGIFKERIFKMKQD
jgi:ATP-dependent protease ClpP protease subunit